MFVTVLGVVLVGYVLAGPIMSDVEIPNYQVIRAEGNIEIRRYDSMILAEVRTQGERNEAARAGFRILAGYIFGDNTVNQEIAMTAPVEQKTNKEIAMTAPVQQQLDENYWQISFVMPSEYTLADLPKPNDERISLKELAPKTFAAIRFSGTSSGLKEHEEQLRAFIKANNIKALDSPKYAFYNPPWTIPPLRRNEVMIEIAQ